MRFDGRDQPNETYGISTHNKLLELSRLSNPLRMIHFRYNTRNFEAQNEIIGSELGITG